MKRIPVRGLWSIGLAVAGIGLAGCYTVIAHPELAPQEEIVPQGHAAGTADCATCHTETDLWSYHHDRYWYGRNSPDYLHDYFAYRYDGLFYNHPWYRRGYYDRWMGYYYQPWWYYSIPTPGPGPVAGDGDEPPVGRGARRDGYDRSGPRNSDVPAIGTGLGMPSYSAPRIPTYVAPATPTGRPAEGEADSVETPSRGRREPSRVEPRYPSQPTQQDPPPPAPQVQQPAQQDPPPSSQQKQAKDDDDDDDEPRGRGGSRRGESGSRDR